MEILIKFTGDTHWVEKLDGVVLVENEMDIDRLHLLLIEQDEYWTSKKNLIKVAPKNINSLKELDDMCECIGRTDIWNLKELQDKIPFIIYQIRF